MSTYYVISGGTFVDVAPHFALAAPAFGQVGNDLAPMLAVRLLQNGHRDCAVHLLETRMALGSRRRSRPDALLFEAAGISDLRTNDDLQKLIGHLLTLQDTRCIVMACATCDFAPADLGPSYGDPPFGRKTHPRLDSSQSHVLSMRPADKVITTIRKRRKDVFLVGFKTTAGDDVERQYLRGLRLLKNASCNLVLANDVQTRTNMVITPEQARYHETTDRQEALRGLADMIVSRSHLTFTRSKVVGGDPVPWSSLLVPDALRKVVNHCIARGAYKPFLGATVGHFAVKLPDGRFLTSRRKTDFNKLDKVGLVLVETLGEHAVIAHGARPSVGGQSQRIVFSEHPDVDCIVHFHCPTRAASAVPVRSQRPYECGSHECGKNTSDGLQAFPDGDTTVKAVMLEKHGPNVVFSRNADPDKVIAFIEANFDLGGRTDDISPEYAAAFSNAEA